MSKVNRALKSRQGALASSSEQDELQGDQQHALAGPGFTLDQPEVAKDSGSAIED